MIITINDYDLIRQTEIENFRIRFLRITNEEIFGNIHNVILKIETVIDETPLDRGCLKSHNYLNVIPANAGIQNLNRLFIFQIYLYPYFLDNPADIAD